MSVLEDERYPSDIAIPGTHASAAKDFYDGITEIDVGSRTGGFNLRFAVGGHNLEPYCRRQDLTVTEQLEAGVRLMDFGFYKENDNNIDSLYCLKWCVQKLRSE